MLRVGTRGAKWRGSRRPKKGGCDNRAHSVPRRADGGGDAGLKMTQVMGRGRKGLGYSPSSK
jgi:hypothetical protein